MHNLRDLLAKFYIISTIKFLYVVELNDSRKGLDSLDPGRTSAWD